MDAIRFYSHVAPFVMVALVVVFGAITAWAYWPRHKDRFERDSRIPLDDRE